MKKAFTLAEVLITLTIVGTIAALTIPHVLQDYKYKLYTAQLKKVYSEVSDAVEMIKNDENTDHFYETKAFSATSSKDEGAQYFLEKYMTSVTKYTDCDSSKGCQVPSESNGETLYMKLDGDKIDNKGLHGQYCVKTKSGATVCAGFVTMIGTSKEQKFMVIATDINGKKNAPNTIGRDVFSMRINHEGIITDRNDVACGNGSNLYLKGVSEYSEGCLNRIIDDDWKMEY